MAVLRECPFRRAVALRAVVAELTTVPVFRLVARRAIEQCFFRLQMGKGRLRDSAAFFEPVFNFRHIQVSLRWLAFELLEANACERKMVHLRRPRHPPLMFEMAGAARADLGMKGGWLTLEERLVVGMADDAALRFHSFDRRVAGRAIILQRRVCL